MHPCALAPPLFRVIELRKPII